MNLAPDFAKPFDHALVLRALQLPGDENGYIAPRHRAFLDRVEQRQRPLVPRSERLHGVFLLGVGQSRIELQQQRRRAGIVEGREAADGFGAEGFVVEELLEDGEEVGLAATFENRESGFAIGRVRRSRSRLSSSWSAIAVSSLKITARIIARSRTSADFALQAVPARRSSNLLALALSGRRRGRR